MQLSYQKPLTIQTITQNLVLLDFIFLFQFSVVDVAAQQGWESSVVKRELKNLQWQIGNRGEPEKSGIMVPTYCIFKLNTELFINIKQWGSKNRSF